MTTHPNVHRHHRMIVLTRRSLLWATMAGALAVTSRLDAASDKVAAPVGMLTLRRPMGLGVRLPPMDVTQATPEVLDELQGTPLGEQLAWFVALINDAGGTIDPVDLEAHFSESFLEALPPEQFIGLIKGIQAGYGSIDVQGLSRVPTESQAVALVDTSTGGQFTLPIAIESDEPHRITGTWVYPVPSADGEPLIALDPTGTGPSRTDGLIDIGDRQLYLSQRGTDGPTVVLESGLGDLAAGWAAIEAAIEPFARVCSYDRSNTVASASDPAPTPRTMNDVAEDLHALLQTAEVPGPYVLVGHSVGGIAARLYASRYPDEIAGLVLVDSSHEDQSVRLQEIVSPDMWEAVMQVENANIEGIDTEASFEQMNEERVANPLQPMPLFVLTAGQPADPASVPEGWPLEAEAELWTELQEDLAGLVPGGRIVVAEQSGHYIHLSQPDLVVEAIRSVVEAVRDPSTWGTPVAATPVP